MTSGSRWAWRRIAAPPGALIFGELQAGPVRYGSDGTGRYYRPGRVLLTAQPERPSNATIADTWVVPAVRDPAGSRQR